MIKRKAEILVPEFQLESDVVRRLERFGRVCYKSENSASGAKESQFLGRIVSSGHESVIEHLSISVLFIVDRGISHEIVRHRIGSYSQESTRYCNYSTGKFSNQNTVIEPFFFLNRQAYELWEQACLCAEKCYLDIIQQGGSPEEARAVLPNSLKTEIVVTYNMREWRHFLRLRCSRRAHPQMRQVSIPLLLLLSERIPVLFSDIPYDTEFPREYFATVTVTDSLLNPLK